nr:LicD family protein [Acinetobacter oleivorans]
MLIITKIVKRAWRESKGFNRIVNLPLAILFTHLIESGRSRVVVTLDLLIGKIYTPKILHYYLAHAHFLNADYSLTRHHLNKLLLTHPYHADGAYLLCETDCLQGRRTEAWERIILLVKNNRRLKSWLVMANLVQDEEDFLKLYNTWQWAIQNNLIAPFHFDVNGYIATGALRAKLYDKAEWILRDLITEISSNNFVPYNKNVVSNFSVKSGEKALLSLKKIFDDHNIPFFLVSGTLLGCMREGGLLAHDKDADVGVWEDQAHDFIEKIIRQSGLFYLQASRTKHVIRAKHVNGTAIDIFFHYREPKNYWHGGVKLKWNNTPFNLMPHNFLGTIFNIPVNYDLYLKENYGDWKTPLKEFDSSTDTTNATIMNQRELQVHQLKTEAKKLLLQN